MLWMKWRMAVDFLRGRRRRLPCFFWFALLFVVGGLVLFVSQQDQPEVLQQQVPGVKSAITPRQSRETLSTQDRERGKAEVDAAAAAAAAPSNPVPPMQLPHFWRSKPALSGSREQDLGAAPVSKRQRKLLKTSPPAQNVNASLSSSFAAGADASERWQKFSGELEARRQLIKKMCAKYKSNVSRTVTRRHVKNIYVEDKHRLLYCQVPKAGCSNWKRTLMVLAGRAADAASIKHDTVHYSNHLKTLDSFDQEGMARRLETYTKVIFVREPLERMVSAYRDKFENPNNYYHSLFGKPIISKYRANATRAALSTGNGVTFQEFVQYLLDVHRPVGMDIHWDQANQLCSPCHVHYDFVGKFENMGEESDLLLRRAGAPPRLTLPTFKDRNPGDTRTSAQITERYFSQVGALERQRVYDFYYMDYLMFNYSKPFKDLY